LPHNAVVVDDLAIAQRNGGNNRLRASFGGDFKRIHLFVLYHDHPASLCCCAPRFVGQ